MRRIIYFSKNDLAYHDMLNKIDVFLKENKHTINSHTINSHTINDVLELYHIIQYLENGFTHSSWSQEEIEVYKNEVKNFKKTLSSFFTSITENQLTNSFSEIDYDYLKTFWLMLNKHGVYKKLSIETLKQLFREKKFRLSHVLYCKLIVDYFDVEICDLIMSDEENAEILLRYFEADKDREETEMFFPKSFTLSKREELILNYLNQDEVNLNYVRLIAKSKDSENLKLSDKTRLKAKKIAELLNNEILNSENAVSIRMGASLSEDQEELKKITKKEGKIIYSYSKKRLLEKIDNINLFKNFKTVFEYLDFQGCVDFVVRDVESEGLERTFMRSKNEFFINETFRSRSMIGSLNFEIYKVFLDSIDISLENIIDEFVNKYLNEKFNINRLKLNLPRIESTYLEKIRTLVPEFESLLDQYKLYVEDDFVDFELKNVSTKSTKISNIPSLLEKKYVYPINDTEFQKLSCNFFNSMSYLFDYERYRNKYQNFYQVILYEDVNIEQFKDNKREYLQHFLDNNYLKLDEEGIIRFVNKDRLIIIGYLKKFEVMSYWYYPKIIRDEIDVMAESKIVKFSNKLFTKAENEYFDFYLNNRYSNGLWLRNKYVHATNSHDEAEQESDYKILLKLFVLLVLKIEDDLNLAVSVLVNSKKNIN